MTSEDLINDLVERTRQIVNETKALQELNDDELNLRPDDQSWNIFECIEHLNYYGNFYLPEIEKCIEQGTHEKRQYFKSGWLGNYFAKSMLPKDKLNKMKTFSNMNPIGVTLSRDVLEVFVQQQMQMLELLNAAREVCLTRTKTAISISKWIKLRLGDTFRVVIYHNQRHIVQANRIKEGIEQHALML